MDHSRTTSLVAAAALAIGLNACGGGSSNSSSSTPSKPASTAQETISKTPSESGALTPPGTTLKLGQEATVAWVPYSEEDPTTAQTGPRTEGRRDVDRRKVDRRPERHRTRGRRNGKDPYFVKVRLEALGGSEPPANEQPALQFDAIDDRGQEQTSVTILGEFEPCEEEQMPKPFTDGASYESCSIYLIRKGGSIDKVEWKSGPTEPNELTAYYDDPIVWEGS